MKKQSSLSLRSSLQPKEANFLAFPGCGEAKVAKSASNGTSNTKPATRLWTRCKERKNKSMQDTFDTTGTAQLLEVGYSLKRNGWTPAEIKELSKGSVLWLVRQVILGNADIKITIDYNADPFIPEGWKVEEHLCREDQPQWNPADISLYIADSQREVESFKGYDLRMKLAMMPVLNANILDYLLANQVMIPEDWKHDHEGYFYRIYFWGTIYRNTSGDLCVRYLHWRDGKWNWSHRNLRDVFLTRDLAALLKKAA